MSKLEDRLDSAEKKLKDEKFREGKGLGNEVDYYIFDYDAHEELYIRKWIEDIRKKYKNNIDGYKVIVFDLYDVMIEILNNKKYLDKCYCMEKEKGFTEVKTAIAKSMRISSTKGKIVEYIKERTPNKASLFITGVGKCYPIIRAHTILNNLHQVIDSVPVVMFYPGKYNGQELILFNEVKDDNYYRAFKLVE